MNYILASASPRRRELLALAGLRFEVRVADVDETIPPGQDAAEAACSLARQKAEAVAADCPDSCVIAADTVVVLDNIILGKPADEADAARMLRLLSGREHRVVTGVCIALGNRRRVFSRETRVRFYALRDCEIEQYVATGEPMDKAGAYGIQGRGGLLAKSIAGDYFNVVGLPIASLVRELEEFTRE